jgi:LPXTG-site transpeptidase (sortase) family protein
VVLPETGFAVGAATWLPLQPAETAYLATDLELELPTLGVNAPIVGVPRSADSWDVTWLGDSVGWLHGSAFPTWAGNTVLTGHVWDADNTPGIFAGLKDLRYGDQVELHAFGQTYIYEVRESHLVTAANVASVFQSEGYDWLTLVSCEVYSSLNGDYLLRRVVRAVLVSIEYQ